MLLNMVTYNQILIFIQQEFENPLVNSLSGNL